MRVSISKSLVSGIVAVALTGAAILASDPAGAAMRVGMGGFGGFHGSMGGFRPGGFAGFHPGFNGFHPGFANRPFVGRNVFVNRNVFINRGFGGCRGGWCGGGWWPGFATGAIVASAASYPYWGGYYSDPYGYGDCWVYRPVWRHGIYLGRRLINICY
jgi:hypothetical protein